MAEYVDMREFNHKTIIFNNSRLPQPKRHRGSGGYYLNSISSSGKRLGTIADNISSFGVLKGLFILLLVANFVRFILSDPNGLTLGSMLNQLSQVKTIPTDWLGTLTNKIRTGLLGSSDNIVAKNVLQILSNLILPLPTILYLIIGFLNIIWWLTSVFSIFFGTFML